MKNLTNSKGALDMLSLYNLAFVQGAGMKIKMLQNPDGQLDEALINDSRTDVPPLVIDSKALVLQVEDLIIAAKELEYKGVEFLWKER